MRFEAGSLWKRGKHAHVFAAGSKRLVINVLHRIQQVLLVRGN